MKKRRVLLRRRNGRRVVDLDVSNRVPLYAIGLQTMAGRREVDYGTYQPSNPCANIWCCLPFCKVSVDVRGFTSATRPWTTVLGGFCSVRVTGIPRRLDDAMISCQSQLSSVHIWLKTGGAATKLSVVSQKLAPKLQFAFVEAR
jgi:hypothetical protein